LGRPAFTGWQWRFGILRPSLHAGARMARLVRDLSVGRKLALGLSGAGPAGRAGRRHLAGKAPSSWRRSRIRNAPAAHGPHEAGADRLREVAVLERDLLMTHHEAGQAPPAA
jgi:hypothetical protein